MDRRTLRSKVWNQGSLGLSSYDPQVGQIFHPVSNQHASRSGCWTAEMGPCQPPRGSLPPPGAVSHQDISPGLVQTMQGQLLVGASSRENTRAGSCQQVFHWIQRREGWREGAWRGKRRNQFQGWAGRGLGLPHPPTYPIAHFHLLAWVPSHLASASPGYSLSLPMAATPSRLCGDPRLPGHGPSLRGFPLGTESPR